MLKMECYEVGSFAVNTYLLWDEKTKQAAIVDPSMGSEGILDRIKKEGLTLEYIINTHGHLDHVYCDAFFKTNAATPEHSPLLLIHEGDAPLLRGLVRQGFSFGITVEQPPEPDRLIVDGDAIALGATSIAVLHTPGHSPGGVCLQFDDVVIVGDTLFAGSIGRTDFPGGDHEQLLSGVRAKLFVLPDATRVYPGHGPDTTIGHEKQTNPFFAGRSSSGLWLP